jgi:hypothetical protein
VDARPAATDAETKPAGVQAGAVKNKGGRPKGVKDTKPRKPKEPKVEPIVEDIITALKAVARDPEFIKKLKERAREGRLMPGEMRLLIDVSRQVDDKPKDKVLMDYATPVERWVILNVARRAKQEPEIGFRLPGTVRDTNLSELCDLAAKLPGLGRKNPVVTTG